MEFRHLRYFMAVAETGSLSRAAEKLFIAQPPLSVQIRQLEEELGAPLFVRHPKGVKLTAAGEALVPEARHLLDRSERLKTLVQGAEVSSHLVLGYVPSASSTVLPALLGRLKVDAPGLHVELREMISSEQIESLVAGHLDAGLMRLRPQHPHLVTAARMADPFCLAMPASTTQVSQQRHPVELRSMAGCDFIAFTRHRGPAYFDQAIHLCAKAGFSPRIRYEASTVHGVLDLVRGGLGVALVPRSCAAMGVQDIRFRTLDTTVPGQLLTLVRRKSNSHDQWPLVERTTQAIFDDIEQRLRAALDPQAAVL